MKNPFVLVSLIAVLTIPAAIINGRILHRWNNNHQSLAVVGEALESLPDQLGEWQQVSTQPDLPVSVQRELGVAYHVHRIYQNADGSRQVTLLALCGDAGPLVRHPVEICYGNQTKRRIGSSKFAYSVDADKSEQPDHQATVVRFESASALQGEFFVAYAFGCQGSWDTPATPRIAYGGEAMLLKVQFLTKAMPDDGECPEALQDFIREFTRQLAVTW